MSAKSNLLKYMELRGIKKPEFYKKTGLSNGFLDKNENISSNNIEIIISNYADISVEWLITGEGEMLKQDRIDEAPDKDLVKALNSTIDAQRITIDAQRDTIIILKEKVSDLEDRLDKYEGGNAHAVAG